MPASCREISRSVRTGCVGVGFAALVVMLPSAPATAELIITPNNDRGGVGSLLGWSYTTDGISVRLNENWGDIDPVAMYIVESASSLFGSSLFAIRVWAERRLALTRTSSTRPISIGRPSTSI